MKHFYRFVKHEKMDCSGVAPLKVDGKLVIDPKIKPKL